MLYLKQMTLFLTALSLSACSMTRDKSLITSSTRPVSQSLASEIDPNYAVAYFPSVAGPILTVRQKSAKNRVHQTVLYTNYGHGGGENQIIVDVSQSLGNSDYFLAPTRNQISKELKRFFPGMAMTIEQTPGQNLHGIYGYAYGSSKIDGNCIFAWQVLSDVTRKDLNNVRKWLEPHYRAKVRARYCHPTKSIHQLLVLMNGFRVKNVVGSTMEMLRFAEGAGYVRTVPQPIVLKTPKKIKKGTSKIRKIKPVKKQAIETEIVGPRVLLPAELGNEHISPDNLVAKVDQSQNTLVTNLTIPLPD